MYIASETLINAINSPLRTIQAKVEHHHSSTLVKTFFYNDDLQSINIERVGEDGKFFGFGICQKAKINIRDKNRAYDFNEGDKLYISFGVDSDYNTPLPFFYVSEVNRDENTNGLTITAYDAINAAAEHTIAEIDTSATLTYKELAKACCSLIGVNSVFTILPIFNEPIVSMNFNGDETIRSVLNAIAEATQTIYYMDPSCMRFIQLDKNGEPVLTIDKSKYFTLKSGENRTLAAICHATELGDNVIATSGADGITQYVRNNPFWELREDIASLLEAAVASVSGMTINQFDCSWRGNFLLEIGDKLELITKDNQSITSYMLNDVIDYNGALSQHTQWNYVDNAETAANPSTLGEVLNQTTAKVDKVNKEIELLASTTNEQAEAIASITLKADEIDSKVQRVEMETQASIDNLNTITTELTTQIQQTSENVQITIEELKASGVDHVTTGKGFTFDNTGLTIEEISDITNNKIKTTITNNGMTVYANNDEMLVANDEGVKAKDLHANTYLIIGKNSRFEDMGSNRTACFWIGS